MQIELVVGRFERMAGQAWYVQALQKYLANLGEDFITTPTMYPQVIRAGHEVLKPLGYDLKSFFATYPVAARLHNGTVKHFTTQQMASLFSFQKVHGPVIITVHDIIPYLMRDDPELADYQRFYDRWMDHLAVKNLQKADGLICVSEYVRNTVINELGITGEKVRVILHGLDLELFRPRSIDDDFKQKYQIDDRYRYILYVGSEIPRKNLPRLLEAFAMVKSKNPNAKLIKLGSPGQLRYHQNLLNIIQKLHLEDNVILQSHVSRDDLIGFYNLADVFVFPSISEGFGLPPLEAMACGAPVICSNAASLPEVVGEAAILIDPRDIQGWADAIVQVLDNPRLADEMHQKSLRQASQFSWERMARQTVEAYQETAKLYERAA